MLPTETREDEWKRNTHIYIIPGRGNLCIKSKERGAGVEELERKSKGKLHKRKTQAVWFMKDIRKCY